MAKLLKVLVVLLLILSAAALVFEIVLFAQREELKGRNILLTRGAIQVAKTLEVIPTDTVDLVTRDLPHFQPTEELFKHFYQVGADGKIVTEGGKKKMDGPGTLDATLKDIAAKADIQYLRLNDTRLGLENTRKTLNDTSNTLVSTVQDLTQTKDTLKKTEGDLDVAKQDITKKTEQVNDLSQKNESLSSEVEKKKEEVAKLTDKVSDTEAKVEATKRYVEKLQKELEACYHGGDTNSVAPGLQGKILLVNTNWNFVVMDLLPDARLVPLSDLTVNRNDKLVGKVRVSEVVRDRRFAFGEILPQWQQLPLAKGDYVFY